MHGGVGAKHLESEIDLSPEATHFSTISRELYLKESTKIDLIQEQIVLPENKTVKLPDYDTTTLNEEPTVQNVSFDVSLFDDLFDILTFLDFDLF